MTLSEAVSQCQTLFAQGRLQECAALAGQILQVQRTNPVALALAAQIAENNGNASQAFENYRIGAHVFPYNALFVEGALRLVSPTDRAELEHHINQARATIPGFTNKPALKVVANQAGKMAVPLYPETDVIAQAIASNRIFEPEIVAVAQQYIRPGSAAIDVGANFGQMSLLFAAMVGASGRVVAIEADDYVHHVLATNIALNQASQVVSVQRAAHERDGETVLFPDQDFVTFQTYGSYGIDTKARQGRPVQTITIDSLQIDRPVSFMKVDVQGCDLFAMRGAVRTIHAHKMPIIFEYEEQFQEAFGTTFDDYVCFVRDIGYKFAKTVNSINYVIVPR